MAVVYPSSNALIALRRYAKVLATQTTPSGVYRALCSLNIDGSPYEANGQTVKIMAVPDVGASFDTFTFDIEKQCEAALAAKLADDSLPDNALYAPVYTGVDSNKIAVTAEIEYTELDDSSGYNEIVASGISTDSQAFTVLNISLNKSGNETLNSFNPDHGGNWSAGNLPLLTSAPRKQDIGLNEGGFLQALNGDTNKFTHIKVTATNAAGALAIEDYISLGSMTDYSYAFASISPNALNSATWALGNTVQIRLGFTYTVAFGTYAASTWTAKTEGMTYTVVDRCIDNIRLHFTNKYGAYDAYTFNFTKLTNEETEWDNFTQGESGQFYNPLLNREKRYNIEQNTFHEIKAINLTYEQRNWLVEILRSPAIYMEGLNASGLPVIVPVKIEQQELAPMANDYLLYEFVLSLRESNGEKATAEW